VGDRAVTTWTRADAHNLAETAMQLGLTPDDAIATLYVGARLSAHGFTSGVLNEMIRWQYARWADDERAVAEKEATLGQMRRFFAKAGGLDA